MKGIFYSKEGKSLFIYSFWIALLLLILDSHQGVSLYKQVQLSDITEASQLNLKAVDFARLKKL